MNEANGPEDRSRTTTGDGRPPIVSMEALVQYLVRANISLERAWSEGLSTETFATVAVKHEYLWRSFWSAIKTSFGEMKPTDDDLSSEISYPPTIESIANLDLGPAGVVRKAQLRLALAQALIDYEESTKAFKEPTVSALMDSSGEQLTWWDSGAFARQRQLALRTARIIDNLHTAAHEPDNGNGQLSSPDTGSAPLMLANHAALYGMDEAVIIYSVQAIRSALGNIVGAPTNSLPSLEFLTSGLPGFGPESAVLAKAEEAAGLIGAGHIIDVGALPSIARVSLYFADRAVRREFPESIISELTIRWQQHNESVM